MKKKNVQIAKAALIAALYAMLTYVSAIMDLAYSGVQFRISEALTILPLFTSAAVPGLAVGCVISNMLSTVNPLDMIIGSAASLLAAFLTRKLRNVTIKGFPLLSFLSPVVVNAIFVAAEIAMFSGEESRIAVFGMSVLTVGGGELAVIFTLGLALFCIIRKNHRVSTLISD